jgi:tetratricopeptide (TPR) repeat protein
LEGIQYVKIFLWMIGVVVLWPSTAAGEACLEFPWYHPRDMVLPLVVQEGQKAMQSGSVGKARELFTTYLSDHGEGVFAEGAKWVLASLPDVSDEPGKEFLKQIERLQAMKVEQPDSVYVPWALCSMGERYWKAGWHSEANALFEEFLGSYSDHPLAGGVMVEAGLGYLENKQFLEAALVLRRVVEEPRWETHRLRGALGLADATAMSRAWRQAYYWYRVVEAENPELIRHSERSSYYYGLTELAIGKSQKVIPRFLTTINLHPTHEFSGKAFNRISEKLLKEGHDLLALWFADQAKQNFKGQEAGRRGQAAQTRWVVKFLSQDHSKAEWEQVYQRLDDLEIYVSMSWDYVVETAQVLNQAPEQDLVEESLLWMGRGYIALQDVPAAIRTFMHLATITRSDVWRKEAQINLSSVLDRQLQTFYEQQAWVRVLKFYEDNRKAFLMIPLMRERVRNVAQAYQGVNLPSKAMHWYEKLLEEYPDSHLREEIFAQKVFLAEKQRNQRLVREVGENYLREYPNGQWRADVSTLLGMESLGREDYAAAIQSFSDGMEHANDKILQRYVLRKRAHTYQAAGKRELALQDLRQVVAMDPQDMADVVRLGDFLFDQGDFDDAEMLYGQVLSSEAPVALKAWAKYRRGLSLEYQGNASEAQKLLAEVRQLETESPEFENTIRAAAVAVLDEFSLNGKPGARSDYEGS